MSDIIGVVVDSQSTFVQDIDIVYGIILPVYVVQYTGSDRNRNVVSLAIKYVQSHTSRR